MNFRLSTVLLAMLSCHASAFAETRPYRIHDESLLFRAADLVEENLPRRVHFENHAVLDTHLLKLYCANVSAKADDLLSYSPSNRQCRRIDANTLRRLEYQSPAVPVVKSPDTASSPTDSKVLKISSIQLDEPAGLVCSCENNETPIVTTDSGSYQQAVAGAPITPVVFSVTDADSESLFEYWSYSLNGGARIAGLPEGLSASCITGTGSLDCTVTGSVTGPAGSYRIYLAVTDGNTSQTSSARFDVYDVSLPEIIWTNNFE